MLNYTIILASQSPRRQKLLQEFGIEFQVKIKPVKEIYPEHLKKEDIAVYLACLKAEPFEEETNESTVIITADTIVCIDDKILGKPVDFDDAVRILNMLSGRKHTVITGVCIKTKNENKTFYVSTDVYFKQLSNKEIREYIHLYKPYDKAGAYGVQEDSDTEELPLSETEKIFISKIGKEEIISKKFRSENLSSHATPFNNGQTGISIIEKIDGSYFNVMGLPVKELYEKLQQMEIIV